MIQKKYINAREVMHTEHLELDGLATVKEALIAMRAANASVVIVRKRHERDAFGILLLSDIAKKVLAKDRAPDRVNVYEIMSKPVISWTRTWMCATAPACSSASACPACR